MAKHHGKGGTVKFGSNEVAHVTKFSVSETVETADSTEMGSTAQEHLVGISSWSGSLDCHYDPADTTGQASIDIGESVTLNLYTDGDASGKKYLSGTATVTQISIDSDMASVVKASFQFKGSGTLSRSTVS